MVALSTTASGGLIPQARHGFNGTEACAVFGSKPAGTGLEKEQIGQIQVAFKDGRGVGSLEGRKGLLVLDTGDEDEPDTAVVPSR